MDKYELRQQFNSEYGIKSGFVDDDLEIEYRAWLEDKIVNDCNKAAVISMLPKIKEQFELRKQLHLETAEYQPEQIDSKWAANSTVNLIEILYRTVEEILGNY